ncbi:MAG: hypothetical protein Q8Q23_01360 [bacterium]|nr:hypothetical protein [bacterium]
MKFKDEWEQQMDEWEQQADKQTVRMLVRMVLIVIGAMVTEVFFCSYLESVPMTIINPFIWLGYCWYYCFFIKTK